MGGSGSSQTAATDSIAPEPETPAESNRKRKESDMKEEEIILVSCINGIRMQERGAQCIMGGLPAA